METYVVVLNYAIPFFFLLLAGEAILAFILKKKVIHSMDTLSSLSSGLTNAIKDVLGLTIIIVSYSWLEQRIGLVDIKATWVVYLIAFVGLDFAGYWIHYLNHKVNYFWNHHIIHHSSEEFNLACALRQSISNFFSLTSFVLIPTALLGVPAEVIGIVAPLHLFAQYWYHTRLIGKLGFLEKIIVTPSIHRVHHAINEIYLDKNLGQIFIIWDKLFGTFQEELDEVPPVYGVKSPSRTWNPIIINFYHLWQLLKDAWRTKSWHDKLRIWFMPTGWRPEDQLQNHPLNSIQESGVYDYEKYNPPSSNWLHIWSWIQFLITFMSMMFLFNNLTELSYTNMLVYAGFLALSIYAYTTLMDRNKHAWWIELIKMAIGLLIILTQGDWFLLNTYWAIGSIAVACYFILSFVITFLFVFKDIEPARTSLKMEVS